MPFSSFTQLSKTVVECAGGSPSSAVCFNRPRLLKKDLICYHRVVRCLLIWNHNLSPTLLVPQTLFARCELKLIGSVGYVQDDSEHVLVVKCCRAPLIDCRCLVFRIDTEVRLVEISYQQYCRSELVSDYLLTSGHARKLVWGHKPDTLS